MVSLCRSAVRGIVVAAFVCLAFVAAFTYVAADEPVLPALTTVYYTIVSAGFGPLRFSQHYEEYGNSTSGFTRAVGRYFSPSVSEWIDPISQKYFLEFHDGFYVSCGAYDLSAVASRLVQGSVSLLSELRADHVPFAPLGLTNPQIRSQPSFQFHGEFEWTSNSPGLLHSADAFIKMAFTTAGLDTSSGYSVLAIIDVYFAADASGNLLIVGDGVVPLRYTIGGQWQDGHGTRKLDIQYDFMQWAQMDSVAVQRELTDPGPYVCYPTDISLLPGVPDPSPPLTPNATLPVWDGGRMMFEVTTDNAAPVQAHALLRSADGQELVTYLANPTTFDWYSKLYIYDFADERNLQFAGGAVYTLNGSQSDPYYYESRESHRPFCTGQPINANIVSPIQWLGAAQINSFFANQATFLSGAKPGSRSYIRGISTDSWSVTNVAAFNGVLYNSTLTVYFTANGWTNMGRISTSLAPQLIRLVYSGLQSPAHSFAFKYTTTVDFFMQHSVAWNELLEREDGPFNPGKYHCPAVTGAGSILPPMPSKYTVTISSHWTGTFLSAQYTLYVDNISGQRRIDGLFTAPNTSAVVLSGATDTGSNSLSIVSWTQNVTLSGGFSALMQSKNLPYTMFQQSNSPQCSSTTFTRGNFSTTSTDNLNFFDWLAQADPSDAVYIERMNFRGMSVDVYQVGLTQTVNGQIKNAHFKIYYLSADTTTATIPVYAAATQLTTTNPFFTGYPQVQYDFYNFYSGVSPGTFSAPSTTACPNPVPPPVQIPIVFQLDTNPRLDGTPMTAPVWPAQFSLLIEGPLFANDPTIYTARWYADFTNFRERVDIEPAFNIPGSAGVKPVTGSYVYYYKPTGTTPNSFSYTNGVFVSYNGVACTATAITAANMNPLKRVAPGNVFDTFFPQTTQTLSDQSTYNMQTRDYFGDVDGVYIDEYDWKDMSTLFQGQFYNGSQNIFVSIPEWLNNGQAGNYSNRRIPLQTQISGTISSQSGDVVNTYNTNFRLTHYQAGNPGAALFDAALFQCVTTPDSPWFNLDTGSYQAPDSSSSSLSSGAVAAVVVGVVVGIVVLMAVYYGWKRGHIARLSKKLTARAGKDDSKELVGVGTRRLTEEQPENSLNRASLNNVAVAVEAEEPVQVHTDSDTATTSS